MRFYTQPLLAYIRYTHPPKPHSHPGHGTNVTPPPGSAPSKLGLAPSGSRTRDSHAGGGRSNKERQRLQPLASVARAPLFEVRRVRFTHSPYWHTSVTQGPHGALVVLNENIITDPHISTLAVLHTEGTPLQLSTNNVRVSLLHLRKTQSAQHWTGLKLQGKLSLLQSADHSVSHSVLMN